MKEKESKGENKEEEEEEEEEATKPNVKENEEEKRLRMEAERVAVARVFEEVREELCAERMRAVQAEIEEARADTHPLLVAQQQEMTAMEGERVWAAEQHHALQLAEMAALCAQECAFARRDAALARTAAQQRLIAALRARRQRAALRAHRLAHGPRRAAAPRRTHARPAPFALPPAPMAPLAVSGLVTPAQIGAPLAELDADDDLACMERAVALVGPVIEHS